MRAHDQLPSSRGLSVLVGVVLHGDIFFVEVDESKHLVPVLLAVCEASLFMYLFVFVDALARAQGKKRLMVNVSEMQRALEDLTVVCTNAGHPIHERTPRRGETQSPSQKFFGVSSALDILRDMRAPIGEIYRLFSHP
jgi:hypothetical protein